VNLRALPFLAAYVHPELVAVEQTQALVHVADSDSSPVNFSQAFRRNSHAVVFDFNQQPAIRLAGAQVNLPAFQARRESVLDRILHHGLQQHAGHERLQSFLVNFLEDLQLVAPEANHFDIQIIVDEFKFLAQRHERLVLAQ
jgi:hypothetical protein